MYMDNMLKFEGIYTEAGAQECLLFVDAMHGFNFLVRLPMPCAIDVRRWAGVHSIATGIRFISFAGV